MKPWEQFEQAELTGRLQLIAGFLATKIANKVIWDVNCGTAPLYDLLPRTFNCYIATDKRSGIVDTSRERFAFNCRDDNDIVGRGIIGPDILCVLGYAAHLNDLESSTLDQTVVAIAVKHQPEYIVIDAWADLPERCGLTDMIATILLGAYRQPFAWFLRPFGDQPPYANRQVRFLEHNRVSTTVS